MDNADMPARIRAWQAPGEPPEGEWTAEPGVLLGRHAEYIRADLHAAEVAMLRKALTWIKSRRPKDILDNGYVGRASPHHGEAAYDMWACANAALENHNG